MKITIYYVFIKKNVFFVVLICTEIIYAITNMLFMVLYNLQYELLNQFEIKLMKKSIKTLITGKTIKRKYFLLQQVLLIFILQLSFQSLLSQSNHKKDKLHYIYFSDENKYLENMSFQWNEFSFKINPEAYILFKNKFERTSDVPSALEVKTTVDDDIYLKYKSNSDSLFVLGLNFKDLYLNLSKDPKSFIYTESVFFINTYENVRDSKKYILRLLQKLADSTHIRDISKVLKDQNKSDTIDFVFSGNKNSDHIYLSLIGKSVLLYYINLTSKAENNWTKEYFKLARKIKFLEIDSCNCFRGIKFGTNLEVIKNNIQLNKYEKLHQYHFYTEDFNYLNWKGFTAKRTDLYFDKNLNLSNVLLRIKVNKWDYYNNFLKLEDEFGEPAKIKVLDNNFKPIDFYYLWEGGNLNITLRSFDFDAENSMMWIEIQSKKFKQADEIDY